MSNTEIKRAMWPILNGKGGVSKTFTASMIAEWLQFCNLPFRLLDCDDNGSLTKRLCEAERQTVKSSNDMEALMMRILESPITLADCPSNITAEVISLFSGADFGPALQSVQGQLIVPAQQNLWVNPVSGSGNLPRLW